MMYTKVTTFRKVGIYHDVKDIITHLPSSGTILLGNGW